MLLINKIVVRPLLRFKLVSKLIDFIYKLAIRSLISSVSGWFSPKALMFIDKAF